MTDKRIFQIRTFLAIAVFIVLLGTLIPFFENWSPGPIYIGFMIFSFITLASGLSLLSEIARKNKVNLKILTGGLSLVIFLFILIPLNQFTNPILGWAVFVSLSGSSILISMFSALDLIQIKMKLRWGFQFLLALNSGIYFFFIFSMILRNYKSFEGGILLVGYSFILSLISISVNLCAVHSFKKIGSKI